MLTPQGEYAYSLKLPFKKKCSLPECMKLSEQVSRWTKDGYIMDFCSTNHAMIGKNRWEEKIKKGIKLGELTPPTNPEEAMEGENL